MSRTLNYTVQRVLDKLNLDPVNSINDTEDSMLIAKEAESTYYDLLSRGTWPFQEKLIKVQSVSDINNPTCLKLGDNVEKIVSLRYDITEAGDLNKEYRRITWLEPEEFLETVYSRNTSSDEVDIVDFFGTELFVYNNKAPVYYTSFDNEYIVLDGYVAEESGTLLGSKTVCKAEVSPAWELSDEFVIPLDGKFYPLYLSALTSACSVMLLNTQNPEEERRQMRAISRLRKEAYSTEADNFPKFNYGRKGNGIS